MFEGMMIIPSRRRSAASRLLDLSHTRLIGISVELSSNSYPGDHSHPVILSVLALTQDYNFRIGVANVLKTSLDSTSVLRDHYNHGSKQLITDLGPNRNLALGNKHLPGVSVFLISLTSNSLSLWPFLACF